MSPIRISSASEARTLARKFKTAEDADDEMPPDAQLVSPGDVITRNVGYMRGHGTYLKNDALHSSVAGLVQRVNKLVSVVPPRTKYQGEVGDVVVGRITEVQQRRWKVETNARLDSVLLLSSVNLPGGELRRRSAEDELAMRQYLKEGDLVSAEVQQLFSDGAASLHTRSLKYGKLSQGGTLVKVSPSLIKRRKTHFHQLPCGASVIMGNNGFVWISPTRLDCQNDSLPLEPSTSTTVPVADREVVARLRNCVLALTESCVMLWDTTLNHAYEASLRHAPHELLEAEVMADVARATRQTLRMEEEEAAT